MTPAKLWMKVAACAACLLPAGCETMPSGGGEETAQNSGGVDVSFLLSMTWAEAQKLNATSLEIPPFYKVAADSVEVLKRDANGQPLRARARGRVFMQVDFREQLVALGQEAYIESGGELIMRGRPLLKRGRSVVEGLADDTVFYIRGTRLQVIGRHRVVSQGGGSGGRPSYDVQPTWSRAWKEGPNPLLPALSPEDVPREMRMNPLLPLPEGDDVPKTLPEEIEKAIIPRKDNAAPAEGAAAAKDTGARPLGKRQGATP